jgi:ribonuclease HII
MVRSGRALLEAVKIRHIIGIDEAGRGPIAGPLAVGAACLTLATPLTSTEARDLAASRIRALFPGVKDSKQLSERAREHLFARLADEKSKKSREIQSAVIFIGPAVIDQRGIVTATTIALRRILRALKLPPGDSLVLLDGLLRAPQAYGSQETIIKGDVTEPIISLASIVAKVSRDRHLVRLARRFPEYGFERHKGYGTAAHYAAIAEHGLSPVHRRSFLLHSR